MHRQASLLILAASAGVLIGVVGNSTWSGDSPSTGDFTEPRAAAATPAGREPPGERDLEYLADTVESLSSVVNAEIVERRVLTEEVRRLQAELLDLKQNLSVRVQEAFQQEEDSLGQASGNADARSWQERLVAAGFTHQQLATIDKLQAEAQMAWIELDDRARREGWLNTPRYAEESRKLSSGRTTIRDALGAEAYDRYLFASGLPNRVAVASIVETSPAQNAGFQPGDVVLTYAGNKVFSNQQLVELRSSGVLGEPVTVEVARNGEVVQLTISRGPMGLGTRPMRVDPADR
jgi:C-terminal processing protease CtpA/Prc